MLRRPLPPWVPEFLADLVADAGVVRAEDSIAKHNRLLSGDSLGETRQEMVLHTSNLEARAS